MDTGIPIRTFLAIDIPEEVKGRLRGVKEALSSKVAGVRWVEPSGIHLTLRFFGDITEESLEKIGEVMLSVGRLLAPFELRVVGVGAFPSTARPRVIWAGIRQSAELSALQTELTRALGQIGFPPETRRFHPHLTMGRARRSLPDISGILENFSDSDFGLLSVSKLILYESRLLSTGAVHLPRRTVTLGAPYA